MHFPRLRPRAWLLILRNLAKLFLTKLNGSVTFSKLAHNTQAAQLAKSHFHFNSHTRTFSFIPGFRTNYQMPEGGARFLRACTRAKTRASRGKGALRVFCVIKLGTRPLKLQPNN